MEGSNPDPRKVKLFNVLSFRSKESAAQGFIKAERAVTSSQIRCNVRGYLNIPAEVLLQYNVLQLLPEHEDTDILWERRGLAIVFYSWDHIAHHAYVPTKPVRKPQTAIYNF